MKRLSKQELKSQDDGRIQCMSVFTDGTILASFNIFPYRAIPITKKQFEQYKQYCEKPVPGGEGSIYYGVIHDNGLPKWFNWL